MSVKYKLEGDWIDANDITGIERFGDIDNIPELSPEEMAQIMGEVEHIDDGTEKLLRAVEMGQKV